MRFAARLLVVAALVAGSAGSAGVAMASPGQATRPFGGDGFSISLAASNPSPWIGQSVTITATTNADVGPTPYFISVYDVTSQTEVAVCGYGTTCSATVSSGTFGTQDYQAYVGDYPPSDGPPGFILVSSPAVAVTWFFPLPPPWQRSARHGGS